MRQGRALLLQSVRVPVLGVRVPVLGVKEQQLKQEASMHLVLLC